MSSKRLVVLGATGSIGTSTLDVAGSLDLEVVAIAARRPGPELASIARRHPDAYVVATGGTGRERSGFAASIPNEVGFGDEALVEAAAFDGTVVNGVVGAAGLPATMAAAAAGNRIALANKESIVIGGQLVTDAVEAGGAEILPVDSEHSALYQLLDGRRDVERLTITASGGPFRGRSAAELADVTPEQALRHPTWDMGRRISIDSATLANKGLEVIEAHHLFGIGFDRIDVVVHPQSIVHSLVALTDGAMLAHVGATDMRIAVQYAITHPDRAPTTVPFRLEGLRFDFEAPDLSTFPALSLAFELGRGGGVGPCIFNAADEVAVAAFLDRRLPFTGIAEVIAETAERMGAAPAESVAHVMSVDLEARAVAGSIIDRRIRGS